MIHTLYYQLGDLIPYVNWIYFFHAWGMPPRFAQVADIHDCVACRREWIAKMGEADYAQAVEADRLMQEALGLLRDLDAGWRVKARFGLFPAWSEEEDIVLLPGVVQASSEENLSRQEGAESFTEKTESGICPKMVPPGTEAAEFRLPFLRQQLVRGRQDACLCLADFIAPKGHFPVSTTWPSFPVGPETPRGAALGVFVTAVDRGMEQLYPDDDFRRMLLQTLCDRLAEAAAEKMHEEVRRRYWGYAPDEHLTPQELFQEKYEGRRPAIGYPSIPDQSMIFLIDRLLGLADLDIDLTENGMMIPHAAVSGLMFDHPAARHFSIGRIGREQFNDYALRRKWTAGEGERYLAAVL